MNNVIELKVIAKRKQEKLIEMMVMMNNIDDMLTNVYDRTSDVLDNSLKLED